MDETDGQSKLICVIVALLACLGRVAVEIHIEMSVCWSRLSGYFNLVCWLQ